VVLLSVLLRIVRRRSNRIKGGRRVPTVVAAAVPVRDDRGDIGDRVGLVRGEVEGQQRKGNSGNYAATDSADDADDRGGLLGIQNPQPQRARTIRTAKDLF
jgi:hypothetical protein